MKMMNAEMEFVTFDVQDVITTSGDGNWFTVSGFTDTTGWYAGEHNTFILEITDDLYNQLDIWGPDGSEGTADVNKVYQLVNAPSNSNYYAPEQPLGANVFNFAGVVADEVSSGTGTQITTWAKLLEWIDQYKLQ